MRNKKNSAIIICMLFTLNNFGQSTPKYMNELYNKIYSSIANESFIQPKLEIINDINIPYDQNNIAYYSPPENTFRVGLKFLQLTRSFGVDSNNARSYVLCHELTHFFKHRYLREIGTGFASSIDKKTRKTKDSINLSVKEFEADQWAYFYSYISGYKINDVAPRLLDTLYKVYHIPEVLEEYPSLKERKHYATSAKIKMQSMCEVFDFANIATMMGDYDMAEKIYSTLHEEGFQSREIKSNLGTAYFLKAMHLIDTSDFKYTLPVMIDFNSRLKQNTRGEIDNDDKIVNAIDNAISQFEGAIKIDKEYVAAYFNLSQVLWLKAYFTKSNSQDYIFYLSKTKEKSTQNEKILADIEVFEAIVNITSNDKEISLKGSKLLNNMADKGNIIAAINIRKLNQIKSKTYPDFVNDLLKTVTPSSFDKINLLDTVFKRSKKIYCNEINNPNFQSRKWKYLSTNERLVVEQHKLKLDKKLTDEQVKQIRNTADNIYYTNNGAYYVFNQLILFLYDNNNCKIQLIK
jgi:hypothetical protein